MQAEKSVTVWAENVEAKNNRLFDVEVYVDSSFVLTAATFEISYDNTVMEYREVNTDIANGQVKAADMNGKVKAIFLKDDGISANSQVKLFSAKFKAVAEGTCDVGISMYGCVDENAVDTNDEASTQCTVTVSGSKSDETAGKDNKKETDETTETEITTEKSVKYLSVASPDDKTKGYLVTIVILVLFIMGLMFYISKLKKDKDKDKQQSETDLKDQEPTAENEETEEIPTEPTQRDPIE